MPAAAGEHAAHWLTNAPWLLEALQQFQVLPENLDGSVGLLPDEVADDIRCKLKEWISAHADVIRSLTDKGQAMTEEEGVNAMTTDLISAREARDKEYEEFIGGMRNPNFAVSRSPDMRAMGRRIRCALDEVADDPRFAQEVINAVDMLGEASAAGFSDSVVTHTSQLLINEFNAKPEPSPCEGKSDVPSSLWEAVLAAGKDPEKELIKWLRGWSADGG